MPNGSHNDYLDVAPAVAEALSSGLPVVALESTIISHGMPYPQNVETAMSVEDTVRKNGATPATIAVLGGRLKVGLSAEQVAYLGERGQNVIKCSRRDLPVVAARGGDGATTVAATMIVAAMSGISVFATGGIGGVHRGVTETLDISADLEELARTDVVVVCAGVKSILDIPRTLEYLETRGVAVIGYGTDTLPAFYTRSSGYPVDYRVDSAAEAAAVIRTKRELGLGGGLVVAAPIPEGDALDEASMAAVIDQAITDMNRKGVKGKETTPFLLARIAEQTGGESLRANVQLVMNNARIAGQIAASLAR